jgi:hypothetical protein
MGDVHIQGYPTKILTAIKPHSRHRITVCADSGMAKLIQAKTLF